MAKYDKYNGLFIPGKYGGYTHYYVKGKPCSRRLPEDLGEKVLKDKAYVRQQGNMREFSAASIAGRDFRRKVFPYLKWTGGSYVSGSLTAVFKKVVNNSPGKRGERDFCLSSNKKLIEGFEFNKALPLDQVLKDKYRVSYEPNEKMVFNLGKWDLEQFPINGLSAGHFKVFAAGFGFSDYYYDEMGREKYRPIHKDLPMLGQFAETGYMEVLEGEVKNIRLEIDLANSCPVTGLSIIGCLGIIFYLKEAGKYLPVKEYSCMKVVGVW